MSYGLKVVGPAGTVIIDGTSDVFRIAATGTHTTPGFSPQPGSSDVSTILSTGLTVDPASLHFLDTASVAIPCPYLQIGSTQLVDYQMRAWAGLEGSDQTKVVARTHSYITSAGSPGAFTYRYYVLEQVAF